MIAKFEKTVPGMIGISLWNFARGAKKKIRHEPTKKAETKDSTEAHK